MKEEIHYFVCKIMHVLKKLSASHLQNQYNISMKYSMFLFHTAFHSTPLIGISSSTSSGEQLMYSVDVHELYLPSTEKICLALWEVRTTKDTVYPTSTVRHWNIPHITCSSFSFMSPSLTHTFTILFQWSDDAIHYKKRESILEYSGTGLRILYNGWRLWKEEKQGG